MKLEMMRLLKRVMQKRRTQKICAQWNCEILMRKRLSVVLTAILLSACAVSTLEDTVSSDYALDSRRGEGLVILSTRWVLSCPPPGLLPIPAVTPSLGYMDRDLKQGFGVLIAEQAVRQDFENPPGLFHAQARKAGDYRFVSIGFGFAGRSYRSPRFSIPFTVREGRATYLGEITVHVSDCRPVDGTFKSSIAVANRWDRDKVLLKQRLPKLDISTTSFDILKP